MTVELHGQAATDAELFVIAWLTPLGAADIKRRSGDRLPFRLVREVTNSESSQQISSYPLVSVHTLAATDVEARTESQATHRRMLVLARDPLTVVDLGGGMLANAEWLETDHGPIWVDYGNDQIYRKVSRYRLALPFTNT